MPIDSNTSFLLHFDNNFTDYALAPNTWTNVGSNITFSNSIYKFGGYAGDFTNSNSKLTTPASSAFNLGSGDWTMQLWAYNLDWSLGDDTCSIVSQSDDGDSYNVWFYQSGALYFWSYSSGNPVARFHCNWTPANNTWYHLAWVRSGSSAFIFINGVSQSVTIDTALGTCPNLTGTFNIGRDNNIAGRGINGYYEEVCLTKGNAQWTSRFVPPTFAYDTIATEYKDEFLSISEIDSVTDTSVLVSENFSISESFNVLVVPSLPVINAKKIISYNPLLIISEDTEVRLSQIDINDPLNPIRTMTSYSGVSGATDITINEISGYIYISCSSGKILKINKDDFASYSIIDISDSNNLMQVDVFPSQLLTYVSTDSSIGEAYIIDEKEFSFINTDFRIIELGQNIISTQFYTIESSNINTQFYCIGQMQSLIKTDFKILSSEFSEIEPVPRTDFHVYINDIELGNDDIDLRSIVITHTIDNESVAEFNLARRHDDMNHTLSGLLSEVTNQNSVKIYIGTVLEFNGKVGQLDCTYAKSNEGVKLTAYMLQPTEQYNSVLLPLPGLNERRNLYHVIIQNPKIYNPYIDPSLDIVKYPPKKFLGIKIKLGIQSEEMVQYNSAFDGSTLANKILNGNFKPIQNNSYFWYTGVKKVHLSFDSNTSNLGNRLLQNDILENNSLYVGTSLSGLNTNLYQLVSCTYHTQREFTNLELKLGEGTISEIEIYENITRFPNYQNISATDIFNALQTYGYIDGSGNILTKFKRTQVPPSQDAVPILISTNSAAIPFYIGFGDSISTKVYNLLSDKLGYTIGSAPFKEISSRNGVYIPKDKYSDETDGLYIKVNDGYNYIEYCKKIAELEYKKLSNINGDILPDTSLGVNLTIDAYYFYKLKLLTRINIDNTTESNIFNQSNGFPVAIKTITINSSDMQVSLNCDNRKSTVELESIDGEFPDEIDPQYFYQGYSYQISPKWDLQSGNRIS